MRAAIAVERGVVHCDEVEIPITQTGEVLVLRPYETAGVRN